MYPVASIATRKACTPRGISLAKTDRKISVSILSPPTTVRLLVGVMATPFCFTAFRETTDASTTAFVPRMPRLPTTQPNARAGKNMFRSYGGEMNNSHDNHPEDERGRRS